MVASDTCTPRAASVEYADAMSSGVTSLVPRTAAGYGWSGDAMPMRRANPMAFAGPTSMISWA